MAGLGDFVRRHFGLIGVPDIGTLTIHDALRAPRLHAGGGSADTMSDEDAVGIGVKAAFSTLLGRYPEHNNSQVLHLSRATCRALLALEEDFHDCAVHTVNWGKRIMRNGDTVVKIYLGDLADSEAAEDSESWVMGRSCGHLDDVTIGERSMIMIPALTEGTELMILQFGPVQLVPPTSYTHFGISVPSSYLARIVIRSFGVRAPCAFLRTGIVGTTAVTQGEGVLNFTFSRPLVGNPSLNLAPFGALICIAQWPPGAASTLELVSVNAVVVSHCSYRSSTSNSVRVIVASVGANVSSTIAFSPTGFFIESEPTDETVDDVYAEAEQFVTRAFTYRRGIRGSYTQSAFSQIFVGM